jgi:hypothetical protein
LGARLTFTALDVLETPIAAFPRPEEAHDHKQWAACHLLPDHPRFQRILADLTETEWVECLYDGCAARLRGEGAWRGRALNGEWVYTTLRGDLRGCQFLYEALHRWEVL